MSVAGTRSNPRPVVVTFGYDVEGLDFWSEPRRIELRAEVVLGDLYRDEPIVTVLDKAVWQDELGDELAFGGVRNPRWIGAEEAAIEAAVERVAKAATEQTAALAEAS